jgi:ATP-dependent exoDNAse (exonuclease V) beta subunit
MRPDGDPASRLTVCPGQHEFAASDAPYSLVWWSPEPAVLALGAQAPFGLRRDDLIVKDVAPAVLRRGLETYHAWKTGRDDAIAAAQRPSIEVMTATAAAATEALAPIGREIEVATENVTGSHPRPGGQRFGSLVHALIADMPLDVPDTRTIARLAAAHGRVLGADGDEIAAAEGIVLRVLRHPVLQAAAHANRDGRCYREMPVTWRTDSGAIIEGFVDLAYVDGDGLVVVDFKTDRELDGAVDRYERQIRIYAAAIAAVTGRPARAVLMRV